MADPYADEPTSQPPATPDRPPTAGPVIEQPPPRRPFLQRHRTPVIAAAAAGVLALAGTGWAIAAASPAAVATAPSAPPAASTPPTHKATTSNTIRGTVQSESGDTWTIRTRAGAGAIFTVTITPKTQFGTKKNPSTAATYPIGTTVVITGRADDSSVTATRISAPPAASDAPTQ